jgi:hypothetical protein
LSGYNSAQANNRIQGHQLRFNTQNANNQNRLAVSDFNLREATANQNNWQFNQQQDYQYDALRQQGQQANAQLAWQREQAGYVNPQTSGAYTTGGGMTTTTGAGQPNISLHPMEAWNGTANGANAVSNANTQLMFPYANFRPGAFSPA